MKKITSITIKPGQFYLLSSIETFNIPLDLTVNFKPRTTLFRSGLFCGQEMLRLVTMERLHLP